MINCNVALNSLASFQESDLVAQRRNGTLNQLEMDMCSVVSVLIVDRSYDSVHLADFWPSEKNDKLTRHAV